MCSITLVSIETALFNIVDTYPDDEQVESRRTMLQHLDSTQLALQQKIMFGGQDGIPQVFGYSEGYRLVQTFLHDHPDLTVEQWTATSPEELLREVQTSHPELPRNRTPSANFHIFFLILGTNTLHLPRSFCLLFFR
ncbi:DUF2268 domain-containing putative Zn-dependent protease [Brevibacillus sp. FSL K6-0770]|uniref:DUF2268 domain-containing putative Zn-dependent protease n=1 Tax=Brevibacillus TaxID=55080 RepID=UPI00156AD387|nr:MULTISPECIES: DUF2268 domain-containing putative Zn-dependent protease [Brevibacillus]MDH6349478.1 hypothetical protein [Brevibacillus sp. 1238]MED2257253.1 DUF2268 domain-containing putative Zn-dependent protease [Brevibacillus parabrevis]NRQ52501.1 hypothetical protein [Brevibacillus sp. HD1.4A]